ncbi:MAG TPA: hypothetical protein VF318_00950 [Dehalococcoidales bacterium]|jgi:hypothetical protein
MARKYDQYIINPPHIQIKADEDGRVVFNGNFLRYPQLGYNMSMGFQFVTKPFISNNPIHTHNFQEFLAWYGGNPNDPDDFGAEVVLYLGEEQEEYVFTKTTMINLPPGFAHCPLVITKVDRPIVQIEIMLVGEGGTREHLWPEDKLYDRIMAEYKKNNKVPTTW